MLCVNNYSYIDIPTYIRIKRSFCKMLDYLTVETLKRYTSIPNCSIRSIHQLTLLTYHYLQQTYLQWHRVHTQSRVHCSVHGGSTIPASLQGLICALRDTYLTHELRKSCFVFPIANCLKTLCSKRINRRIAKHIFGMKMKIPNGSSGNDYGHETDIISYMDNNFDSEIDIQGAEESDFSEYLWMENEEEFDKEVIQQLMEEELTEECLKAMWEDERQHERNTNSIAWSTATSTPENSGAELSQQLSNLKMHDNLAKQSTLNPNAAEFVPAFKSAVTSVSTPPEVTTKSS